MSHSKTPDARKETVSSQFKKKKEIKCSEENSESITQSKRITKNKDSTIPKASEEKSVDATGKIPELKNEKLRTNSKGCVQNSSSNFIEKNSTCTKKSKQKIRNSFNEDVQKSVKKQKISHKNVGTVICSPLAQKWTVEDSKR